MNCLRHGSFAETGTCPCCDQLEGYKPSLKEYYEDLKAHDWFYHMSDDLRFYQKGQKEFRALVEISLYDVEYTKLFDAFEAHYRAIIQGKKNLPELPESPK